VPGGAQDHEFVAVFLSWAGLDQTARDCSFSGEPGNATHSVPNFYCRMGVEKRLGSTSCVSIVRTIYFVGGASHAEQIDCKSHVAHREGGKQMR
jgi:hypothetical protein